MGKIAIYYGSDMGNTKSVAKELAKALDVANDDVYDVASAKANFEAYDVLLFGSSTMGFGDIQDDWSSFLEKVEGADLQSKKVAIFGCGDSASYSETFCDAIGEIYNAATAAGANIIGKISTDGYTFDESKAVVDGNFVGLPIDEDNESDQTAQRISSWVAQLNKEI